MSTTALKISKKMASLLATYLHDGGTHAKVEAETAAGRADKAGAVNIEVPRDDAIFLHGFALGRKHALDAALEKASTDDERKPLFGEHSAWSALLRQLPAVPQEAA
jgi:hypothetical protein